jgi:eukaryotic-like serine/threonine-protein kinase
MESALNGKGSSSKHRPDRFGPFAVRADLGASRFGPVYLGHDPSTNARVVIRTFELSREQREFGEQTDLLDSLRKLCETTIDHPGVARPLAFGVEREIPYLVYSHLAGTAMDAVVRQDGARPVAEVLQRTQQLADAIDSAASAGVYHGMMTPGDVILDAERTGVTGCGLAQALIKAAIPAEAEAPYGSPQRLAGAPPTRADDIYSLAAIALELLIGRPKDPDQETRALREAQGLPECRLGPRPAPHETRMFTTIAGVDAGKLRACFAAAFSDEPSERPSTAAEFMASVHDAVSSKRETEEPAPKAETVPVVSEARKAPPPAATPDPPFRLEAKKPRASKSESPVIRLAPIVDDEFLSELTPPRASSMDASLPRIAVRPESLPLIPVRPESRVFVAAAVVIISFAAGFGGGFVVGHFSKPSTESIDVSQREPVAEPQPARPEPPLARTSVEEPQPIAPAPPPVAPISEEKVAKAAPVAPIALGRVLVRSTPAGAGVMVDGQSRGVTPLAVRDLALGAHTIEVSHPGHDSRQRRVTLSERRPARSLDFELRPVRVLAPAPATAAAPATAPVTAAANATGSLQVASRPTGAQVFVDDNLIGTTPLLLSDVAAGSRRLRIELTGYQSWTRSVQIKASARARVAASLEP